MEKPFTKEKPRSAGAFVISRGNMANVAVSFLGFFVGRVVIFSFMNPLGAAFLSAYSGTGYRFYLTAVFIAFGLTTKLKGIFMIKYMACFAIMCAANAIIEKLVMTNKTESIKTPIQCTIGAACVFACSLAVVGRTPYFIFMAALEAALVFSLTFLMKKSTRLMSAGQKKTALENEDIISLAILSGAVIAGASDIYVGPISLCFFLSSYAIMLAAHKAGPAAASSTGLLLGLVLSIAGRLDMWVAVVFAAAGIGGGLAKKYGKPAVSAAYLFTGAVVIYLYDRTFLDITMLYSVVLAGVLLFMVNDGFTFNLAASASAPAAGMDAYITRVKETTTHKLKSFADSFDRLARTFSGLTDIHTDINISALVDDLAENVCRDCDQKEICWGENFYKSYLAVFNLLETYEKNGEVAAFEGPCTNPRNVTDSALRLLELYKTNQGWSNRIAESRELISQQLSGVSGIIKELANEIDVSMKFDERLEKRIANALTKNKIEVDSVIVLENKQGKYEVTINHKPCYGKRQCAKELVPLVSGIVKRKMRAEDERCSHIKGKGGCGVRLVEDKKLRVTCGVARASKNKDGESGDSYSFMELKNGQCLLVLSDGMGSGKKAREESAATVELLEDFVESGFEKEIAVKLINSVLVLKSSEESFSTLDICTIDLYTGDSEFIKIGAAATYLLRDGRVQIIRSASLPMGILDDVDLEVSTRQLLNNDVLIMVTDGVLSPEDWITDALKDCHFNNPQDIADHLLSLARVKNDDIIRDDMTVLAARVWEKL